MFCFAYFLATFGKLGNFLLHLVTLAMMHGNNELCTTKRSTAKRQREGLTKMQEYWLDPCSRWQKQIL